MFRNNIIYEEGRYWISVSNNYKYWWVCWEGEKSKFGQAFESKQRALDSIKEKIMEDKTNGIYNR